MPSRILSYGSQSIDESDCAAVLDALRSQWLTQGPAVPTFEAALAQCLGARHVVACCNGTAALHLAYLGLGLGAGDAVLTSPISFMATANAARQVGARVLFADIDPLTATLDPRQVESALAGSAGKRVAAITAVDFAGQPADIEALSTIARSRGLALIEDACHALGGRHADGAPTGSPGRVALATFSFHPVKPITTAEGGAIATNDNGQAARLRRLASHGIARDNFLHPECAMDEEGRPNPWYHEMRELGFNYRLSDLHAALGASQLKRLDSFREKRARLAALYDDLLAEHLPERVVPLGRRPGIIHAWHLYVVRIPFARLRRSRASIMNRLREENIFTQVHYIPIHLQPYYRELGNYRRGDFPEAERYYDETLSLPLFVDMNDSDVGRVVEALARNLDRP